MSAKRQAPAPRWILVAGLIGVCGGCVGSLGDVRDDDETHDSADAMCLAQGPNVGPTPLRRLSAVEYERTIRSLFPEVALGDLPIVADETDGFENDAMQLNPSPLHIERYAEAARAVAAAAVATPAWKEGLPCVPASVAEEVACGRQFVESFGAKAYRRPLTAEQSQSLGDFFERQRSAIDYDAALELTLVAILQSSNFLYRVETASEGGPGQIVLLDAWELASRLSYFVWGSMPDAELFAVAASGHLLEASELEAQVRRMMDDPQARAQIVDFHRQWLDFDRLEEEEKDPTLFPDWTPELADAARQELDRFVERVLFEGEGTLGALLLDRETEVNAPLADLYGLAPMGSDWTPMTLPPGERAGILTTAGFLASRAHATNGSPPLRGAAIFAQVLCGEIPSPPEDADLSTPVAAPGEGPKTNRQLFEERTAPAECQTCHQTLDGIGFGLEHYDSIGRYRTEDNGLPVDATGELFGTDVDGPYDGAVELMTTLAASPQVNACYVRQWFRFERGRVELPGDECQLSRLAAAFAESGGSVQDLIVALVSSDEFRQRTVVEPQP